MIGSLPNEGEGRGVTAQLRVLSMGWGRQTWTLAAMMALGELPRVDFVIHADTTHEMAGTYEFRRNWEPWLGEHGLTVVTVRGQETDAVYRATAESVLVPAYTDTDTSGGGQLRRSCTDKWKIRPLRRFIRAELARRGIQVVNGAAQVALGISYDEIGRMRPSDVGYVTNVYPLIERKLRLRDCLAWLESRGLPQPPKSACTFCPYHNAATWKNMKRQGGPDWAEAIAVDTRLRTRRPPFSLFVHDRRLPLADAVNIPEDHGAVQTSLFGDENGHCESGYCMT